MKKYLTVNVVICLVAICSIVACYWKFNGVQATFVSFFVIVIAVVIVEARDSMRIAKETLNSPCRLSTNDAGCSFSVEDLRDDKIGLTVYGPDSDSRFLIKAGHMRYYSIDQFPFAAREIGTVIHVSNSSGGITIARKEGLYANLLIPKEG